MIMFIDGHYNPDTVCIIALPALINAASYLKKTDNRSSNNTHENHMA